jgi:hypothetical protein
MFLLSGKGPVLAGKDRLIAPRRFWLMFQALALAAAVAWQFIGNAERARLFWSDPLGFKMGVAALVLLGFNFALLLGGWLALDRLPGTSRAQALLGRVVEVLLCGACFVLLYLPALFVVLVGPAALTIRATLLRE